MKKFAILSSLCALLCGCISVDEITLTTQEADALVANIETAIQAQQEMTKLTLALARGETDIAGYTYDPPVAGNGFVGTLNLLGAVLPFGTGDIRAHPSFHRVLPHRQLERVEHHRARRSQLQHLERVRAGHPLEHESRGQGREDHRD